MRVICIGDSLGLPREDCPYESTWFYKLKEDFKTHEFIDFFVRGLEIKDALHRFDTYFKFYKAEIAIIQTGIVDCAPRYICDNKRFVRVLIFIFKTIGLEKLFWKVVKLGGRRENCVYTRYEIFKETYGRLVSELINNGVKKVIIVQIGHATDGVLKRNAMFNKNVDKYNMAIEEISKQHLDKVITVKPLNNVEEQDFVDGYHCNPNGMSKVYVALKKEIAIHVEDK